MNLSNATSLKFAIPNKGRLHEPTVALLKRAGYSFRMKDRALYASCTNADIIFIFVRAEDIPVLVASSAVDIGITGQDLVIEKKAAASELLALDFGKCRLCVAVPGSASHDSVTELAGAMIATSFPGITSDYFTKQHVPVTCLEMNGSIEITVALGIADAIVDIVETGDSLKENNLRIFKEIGSYQTVLIASPKRVMDERVQMVKRRIEGILIANSYSILEYNIPSARLKDAEKITPGFESPTVAELDEPGWLAVKVMVEKNRIADAMDKLEALGATGLFETEIKNCRLGKSKN
ncbi:MAG: ATP phosphoribosyltransferase [Spirochaetes bacterium]|nr:ATP phosphoribosyltransferase [Spirochaetota bacterium]